jgi:hypothetical protein
LDANEIEEDSLSVYSYNSDLDDEYDSYQETDEINSKKENDKEIKGDLINVFNRLSLQNADNAWEMGVTQRSKTSLC